MRIFHTTHKHPLTFRKLYLDAKRIILVMFCDVCQKELVHRIDQ